MPENLYPLTQEPEPPATDWTALSDDPLRLNHEAPWLRYEMQQAVDKGLQDQKPGREYWLGYRDALKMVLTYPEQQVQAAAEELAAAQETRRKEAQNARRIPAGNGFLRRLSDYWTR
jgi:hypothetical protein